MNQKETEQFMRTLLGAVDDIVQEATGERMALTILLAPFNKPGRSNYISNANKEDMMEMLRGFLIRAETGNIDPPFDQGSNPTQN